MNLIFDVFQPSSNPDANMFGSLTTRDQGKQLRINIAQNSHISTKERFREPLSFHEGNDVNEVTACDEGNKIDPTFNVKDVDISRVKFFLPLKKFPE